LAAAVLTGGLAGGAAAEELNIYTSRHYQSDERLYEAFTGRTGIQVNRIEGKGDALIARIASEGANSPADLFVTADAGLLWRADQAGLFQAVESEVLQGAIPDRLRHPEGRWFGFSTRARLIYYDKATIDPAQIQSYQDLADPKWRGKVCIRSSSNIYNQSLLGAIIAARGPEVAEAWAAGVVANFARDPQGGDTDQIRGVAAGQCALALANSYYYVRLMTSAKDQDRAVAQAVGWIFPDQGGRGSHVNVSGAGVLAHAPHRDAAVAFLEFLAGAQAQRHFAEANNEYPVVDGVAPASALASLGNFRADPVNVSAFGEHQAEAQRIFDRVGWK
jgi:iron(III) transport system substrate-binding protein